MLPGSACLLVALLTMKSVLTQASRERQPGLLLQ